MPTNATPTSSATPVVGITCNTFPRAHDGRPAFGNNATYVHAVLAAGGAPLLIPPMDLPGARAIIDAIYDRLDGLLLSGGPDVDPSEFGEEAIAACGVPDLPRDAIELALARRAVADGLPILGICRGFQVLNIALGGTLYQDIETQLPEADHHQRSDDPRDQRAHSVRLQPDSHVARVLGTTEHMVNSLHHQAVAQPAPGVRIVGYAPDGVAEALELPEHPFALAVQYHPEELAPTDPVCRKLFAAFVQACAQRMQQGEPAALTR